jgi:hypothetical protein
MVDNKTNHTNRNHYFAQLKFSIRSNDNNTTWRKCTKSVLVKPVYIRSQQCKEQTFGQETFHTNTTIFFLLASFNGDNHFKVCYARFDQWLDCRSLTVMRLFRPILIDIAKRKNSPGNSFASCSFVYPFLSVRLNLFFLRNDSSVFPDTLLSKNRRTAWVAIFWQRPNKRKKLLTSFDRESASSVNKRTFYHTNFVFINAKCINKSKIQEFVIC